VTGFAKTKHNSVLNSTLLHFYDLHIQMYLLENFQLCVLKAFEVTALQCSSSRKISKCRE